MGLIFESFAILSEKFETKNKNCKIECDIFLLLLLFHIMNSIRLFYEKKTILSFSSLKVNFFNSRNQISEKINPKKVAIFKSFQDFFGHMGFDFKWNIMSF